MSTKYVTTKNLSIIKQPNGEILAQSIVNNTKYRFKINQVALDILLLCDGMRSKRDIINHFMNIDNDAAKVTKYVVNFFDLAEKTNYVS
jgi:uncharacterized protein YbcV (DUF1398 family)